MREQRIHYSAGGSRLSRENNVLVFRTACGNHTGRASLVLTRVAEDVTCKACNAALVAWNLRALSSVHPNRYRHA